MDTTRIGATANETVGDAGTSLGSRAGRMLTLGGRLGRRNALVVWLSSAVGLGLVVGWPWIVAAGFAPLVLGLLPCAAMCALGLCGGSSAGACSSKAAPGGIPPNAEP